MPAPRQAHLGIALCLLSVIGLAFSIPWLVGKLRARNVKTMRLVAQFEEPAFDVNGMPFSVTRVPSFEDEEPGDDVVLRLAWRGQTHDFPMGEDEKPLQPGLKKYGLWFGVMLLADGAATRPEFEDMWSDPDGPDVEFVAAARYYPSGMDPETFGKVFRTEWEYEFAHLRLDGPDEDAIEVSRKTYEAVDALYLPGVYTDEEYIPTPEERERDLWQYYAMLYVTPPEQVRGRNKVIDPLMRDMGLAWPAAGTSVLGLTVGVILIGMGIRGREDGAITP